MWKRKARPKASPGRRPWCANLQVPLRFDTPLHKQGNLSSNAAAGTSSSLVVMVHRNLCSFVLGCLVALLTGCVNGYKEFYRPVPGATPETIASKRLVQPTGRPLLDRVAPGNLDTILAEYEKRGFALIGTADFNSSRVAPESEAYEQAVAVGADLVVVFHPTYTHTVTSSVPVTTPWTSTTTTTGHATAYGAGGTVNVYGSGIATTRGTSTTYVPMSVSRHDQGALFLVRQRFTLGAFFRDLTDSERQGLQTNKGAAIRVIVDRSPAFEANLLVGDIVISIDGVVVVNSESAGRLLDARRGRVATIAAIRRGELIQKSVRLAQ